MSVASLPMYDWPVLLAETDTLWAALRDAIRAHGIDAPDSVDRTRMSSSVWTDPELVLSQTCGMPWRLGLHRQAQLVGTPDYGVEGCPAGYYRSVIVVRHDDKRATLDAFAGAVGAVNSPDSQSGYAALITTLPKGVAFSSWLETGAHDRSIDAVAQGHADVAAIDAVTWRIATRFQPAAWTLRVLLKTEPTPGLPFITSKSRDAQMLFDAATRAISPLTDHEPSTLGLRGLVWIPEAKYMAVGERNA